MRAIVPLFVALLLYACGNVRSTVGDGMLQKRRLGNGWHVDLHRSRNNTPQPVARTMERLPAPERMEVVRPDRSAPSPVLASASPLPHHAPPQRSPLAHTPKISTTQAPDPQTVPVQDENLMHQRKLDVWAIPALVVVLAAGATGFLSNSVLLVAGLLVLGFVLCAISIRRIRRRDHGGKGFAVAALILGTILAVLTLLVFGLSGA